MGGGAAYSSTLITAPLAGSSSPALNSLQHSIHHRRRRLPRGGQQPQDPQLHVAERGEDPPAGNDVGDVEEARLVEHPHEVRYFRSNNGGNKVEKVKPDGALGALLCCVSQYYSLALA